MKTFAADICTDCKMAGLVSTIPRWALERTLCETLFSGKL